MTGVHLYMYTCVCIYKFSTGHFITLCTFCYTLATLLLTCHIDPFIQLLIVACLYIQRFRPVLLHCYILNVPKYYFEAGCLILRILSEECNLTALDCYN